MNCLCKAFRSLDLQLLVVGRDVFEDLLQELTLSIWLLQESRQLGIYLVCLLIINYGQEGFLTAYFWKDWPLERMKAAFWSSVKDSSIVRRFISSSVYEKA